MNAKRKTKKAVDGISMSKARARAKKLAALVKTLELVDVQARQEGQAVSALGRARTAVLDAITTMAAGKSG
jgi:hypothetical protein